jgi:hypothetical protein
MKKFLVLFNDGYYHQSNFVEAETPDQAIEMEVKKHYGNNWLEKGDALVSFTLKSYKVVEVLLDYFYVASSELTSTLEEQNKINLEEKVKDRELAQLKKLQEKYGKELANER